MDKFDFGDLGSRTFQSPFEALNSGFWGQNFVSIAHYLSTLFYTSIDFQQHENHLN
jgi:hypothetical protein